MFDLKNVRYKNILTIPNLHIPSNKITCIIGESGSGKTTLLKLLNKFISCTDGEIFYKKRSLKEINAIELRREVIMLPQTPIIFGTTIKDNLLIGLQFSQKHLASDHQLIETLDMLSLHKNLDENAEKLSGGEKQRICLGRVLLMNPEAFLLDEPSASLDKNTEQIIMEKLSSNIRNQNKTLIMVTHSKEIADSFADNIIEVKNGTAITMRGA
jgi:putative ABC transport system ATP-binding protein